MIENPKITIIIPTYNRVAYLVKSLESALQQSYQNIEVIVSDNASTDETQEIIKQFKDARLKVNILPVNIGMRNNWNAGVNLATGKYLIILSDDDLLDSRFIEACVERLRDMKTAPMIIYSRVRVLQNDVIASITSLTPVLEEEGNDFIENWIGGRRTIYLCGTLFHTDMLKSIGGFPEKPRIMTDSAAIMAVAYKGKVGYVNEVLSTYRIHTASTSKATSFIDWIEDEIDLNNYCIKHFNTNDKHVLNKLMMNRLYKSALARIIDPMFNVQNKYECAYDVISYCFNKYGIHMACRVILNVSAVKLFIPKAIINKLKKIKSKNIWDYLEYIKRKYITMKTKYYYGLFLKKCGNNSCVYPSIVLKGLKYIKLGSSALIFFNCRIELVDRYGKQSFQPELSIGDYAQIHQNAHITCANCISIGENVVITSNVTITDIIHPYDEINIPINLQDIKVGSVFIGDQTYIYNNCVILPNVKIGKHCVIGANSVVSHDIPDYCIAVGSPAVIIKRYNIDTNKWEKVDE